MPSASCSTPPGSYKSNQRDAPKGKGGGFGNCVCGWLGRWGSAINAGREDRTSLDSIRARAVDSNLSNIVDSCRKQDVPPDAAHRQVVIQVINMTAAVDKCVPLGCERLTN